MRKIIVVLIAVVLGFSLKAGIVEVERFLSVRYVDACLDQHSNPMQEQELKCYAAPQKSPLYRIVSALNFQPGFWKNSDGRCAAGSAVPPHRDDYFECGWWNRRAL